MLFRRASLALIIGAVAAACGTEASNELLTIDLPAEGGKNDNLSKQKVQFDITYQRNIAIPDWAGTAMPETSTLHESVAVWAADEHTLIVNGEVYVVRPLDASFGFELWEPDGLANAFTEMAFTLWFRPGGSSAAWKPIVATDDTSGERFSYFNRLGYTHQRLFVDGVKATGRGQLFDSEIAVPADAELGILPLPVRDWGDIEGSYPFVGKFEFTRR